MTDTKDIIAKSVTANEGARVVNGSVVRFIVPFVGGGAYLPSLPPVAPAYWSPARDIVLRSTAMAEPMWAGAISIAITKIASAAWQVESGIPIRAKRAQNLLHDINFRQGWVHFLSQHLRDFLTTDNGAFVEIIRSGRGPNDAVVGLRHLDSLRCTRTGDNDIPVLYRDRAGKIHELKSHQVFALSDMPDPGETYYDVGLCAASRAYQTIFKQAAIEWYLREKVSGQRPLAIHMINGLISSQIEDAIRTAKEEQISRQAASYMGAVIVGLPEDTPPSLVTIPLAEFPDRFDRKQEFDLSLLTYANEIGLDPQDLQPLSGQGLGTGTQSVILSEKASGRGLAAWRQAFTHAINNKVFEDDETVFVFAENDYRDAKAAAEVQKMNADVATARIAAGITSPDQERQILLDKDDLPRDMFEDTSGSVNLSDTDKPDDNQTDETAPGDKPNEPATNAERLQNAVEEIREKSRKIRRNSRERAKQVLLEEIEELHAPTPLTPKLSQG